MSVTDIPLLVGVVKTKLQRCVTSPEQNFGSTRGRILEIRVIFNIDLQYSPD
jgi:hypothetical protein